MKSLKNNLIKMYWCNFYIIIYQIFVIVFFFFGLLSPQLLLVFGEKDNQPTKSLFGQFRSV